MDEKACPFYQELVKSREQIRVQGLSIKGLQRQIQHLLYPEKEWEEEGVK